MVHIAIKQAPLTSVLGWAINTGLPEIAAADSAPGKKRLPRKTKRLVRVPCSSLDE